MTEKPTFEVHWYPSSGWARLWCTAHSHPVFDPVNSMKEAGDKAVEHFRLEHPGESVNIVILKLVESEKRTVSA